MAVPTAATLTLFVLVAAAWGRVSANGGFIAFGSAATNLTAEDRDRFWDIFVRDLRGRGR